jgi:hypothetical protein
VRVVRRGVGALCRCRSGRGGGVGGRWHEGGDFHPDLAVADAAADEIRLALTPGDRLITTGSGIKDLAAGQGRLAWSRRVGPHRYRLIMHSAGGTSDVPVAASTSRLRPRLGRLGKGRAAITYVACRHGRCRAHLWDIRRHSERRVGLPAAGSACEASALAVWDDWTAFELVRRGHGRCKRGVWAGRSGHFTRRGVQLLWPEFDLRAGWLAIAGFPRGLGWELLLERPGGRAPAGSPKSAARATSPVGGR